MSAIQLNNGMLVIDKYAELDGTHQVHWFPVASDEVEFPIIWKNGIRCSLDDIFDGFNGPMKNGTHKAWKKVSAHKPSARKSFIKK